MCYDIDAYQGVSRGSYSDQDRYKMGLGAGVVIQLCSTLPQQGEHLVAADYYFSSLQLVEERTKRGIYYVGTARKNRLEGCRLQSERDPRASGRGSVDYKVMSSGGKDIIAVKWYDNGCVTLLSNCEGADPAVQV